MDVFQGRSARSAVNMPALSPEVLAQVQPYLPLAEQMASLAAQITEGRPSRIAIATAENWPPSKPGRSHGRYWLGC